MLDVGQVFLILVASMFIYAGILEILQGIEEAQKTRVEKARKYALGMYLAKRNTSFISYKITA